MEFDKQFGANIRKVRRVRGFSLQELSNRIANYTDDDVSPSLIGMWERGERRPSAYYIDLLCKVLLCTPNLLFPGYDVSSQTRIMQEFNVLPKDEQEIMEYAATKWPGNIHALVHFVGIYMQLTKQSRSNIAFSGIMQYEEEKEEGLTDPEAPPADIDYVVEQWKLLKKD